MKRPNAYMLWTAYIAILFLVDGHYNGWPDPSAVVEPFSRSDADD